MGRLGQLEMIQPVGTQSLLDGDRTVITTTLYDLVATIQSILGPEDEQVVPAVTQILRTGHATFQEPAAYRLSA